METKTRQDAMEYWTRSHICVLSLKSRVPQHHIGYDNRRRGCHAHAPSHIAVITSVLRNWKKELFQQNPSLGVDRPNNGPHAIASYCGHNEASTQMTFRRWVLLIDSVVRSGKKHNGIRERQNVRLPASRAISGISETESWSPSNARS